MNARRPPFTNEVYDGGYAFVAPPLPHSMYLRRDDQVFIRPGYASSDGVAPINARDRRGKIHAILLRAAMVNKARPTSAWVRIFTRRSARELLNQQARQDPPPCSRGLYPPTAEVNLKSPQSLDFGGRYGVSRGAGRKGTISRVIAQSRDVGAALSSGLPGGGANCPPLILIPLRGACGPSGPASPATSRSRACPGPRTGRSPTGPKPAIGSRS